MKKLSALLLASACVLPLAAAGPAGAQTGPVSGQVQMTVHTHSGSGLVATPQRLPYNFVQGSTFTYASRLCSFSAPFNDIGLNFMPNYPGVDDDADGTARVRHVVTGTVTQASGPRGVVQGTIRTILCQGLNGSVASEHVLVSHFTAQYILQAETSTSTAASSSLPRRALGRSGTSRAAVASRPGSPAWARPAVPLSATSLTSWPRRATRHCPPASCSQA
jgi:hypothetical protein